MRLEELTYRLKKIPIFRELEDDEIAPISQIAQTRMFKKKKYVCMQGGLLTKVYFILSGKIKIYKMAPNGKEQIISILEAGEMFPHAGFFRHGEYPAHAEVIEDAQLITIPIQAFENVLIRNPSMCIKLFKILGEKIVDLQDRLEEQILHSTNEQIILLLLRLAKTNGKKINDFYKITTPFTNREFANMIGTSPETVGRTLNLLKKKNILTIDEDGLLLINPNTVEILP